MFTDCTSFTGCTGFTDCTEFHGLHEAHGFYGFHELHERQRIWIFPTNFKEPEIFFALFSYIAAEAKK